MDPMAKNIAFKTPVAFVCSHPGRRISLTRLSLSSPPRRRYQIATCCYHRIGVKKDYYVYKISPNFADKIQKELAETGEGGFVMESDTNLSSQATISISPDAKLFVHSMEIIAFGGVLFIGIAAAIYFIVMVFQGIKEGNRNKAYVMNMADKSEVDAAAARFFSRFFKEV